MPAKVPVCIRGVTFISISAAARHFGLHRSVICRALDAGTIDHVGFGSNWANKQPVWFNGSKYESQTACASAIGANRTTIRNAIARARKRKQRYADCRYGRLYWTKPAEAFQILAA